MNMLQQDHRTSSWQLKTEAAPIECLDFLVCFLALEHLVDNWFSLVSAYCCYENLLAPEETSLEIDSPL